MIPATSTAPAFTIDGFTDLSFPQHRGWALRAGAKYQLSPRWSVEPSFIHWDVGASPVRELTATFTVNGIPARQQLGALEPDNVTNEVSVGLGFHF
jgi:opacity protein-like surface antigen